MNQDHYDRELVRGESFQELVKDTIASCTGFHIHYYGDKHSQFYIGESQEGVEVKLDATSQKTRRYSIETAEDKSGSGMKRSGILREDNTTTYVQGNYREFFAFTKRDLVDYRNGQQPTEVEWGPPDCAHKTIRRFFVERDEVLRIAKERYWKDARGWRLEVLQGGGRSMFHGTQQAPLAAQEVPAWKQRGAQGARCSPLAGR